MANTDQSKKRARQADARYAVNKARRSRIRTFLRKVEEAIASGNGEAAQAALQAAQPELARGVTKGVLHKNTVARKMSRLASRSIEQPPSFLLRLRMRLHHLICVWCRRYERQLKFLHRAAPRTHEEIDRLSARGLSPEARQRLVQRLREAVQD